MSAPPSYTDAVSKKGKKSPKADGGIYNSAPLDHQKALVANPPQYNSVSTFSNPADGQKEGEMYESSKFEYKNFIVDWEVEEEGEEGENLDLELSDVNTEAGFQDKKISKVAENKFGDVLKLAQIYCADWEDSPLDIAAFFFCLSAFKPKRTATDEPIFDENLILTGYHFAQLAFASYSGPDLKFVYKRIPFLPKNAIVAGNWNKEELKAAPAWFIAVDEDVKSIVVSLRGTKQIEDILVDLTARYVKWKDGYAHQGFVKSLTQLEPFIKDTVIEQMEKYPGYSLRICGHSMGAAVSSLLTLKWVDDFPQWDIHGYGYATPCVISRHLVEKSKIYFTTFIHHYDAVSRLSLGSIQDMHNALRMFVEKVGKGSSGKAFAYMMMGKLDVSGGSKRIMEAAKEVDSVINNSLDSELSSAEPSASHLFPAGVTYQFWREKRGKKFGAWEMYPSYARDYARLQFSPTMLKDHGSDGYNSAFENLLTISVVERKIWLSLKPSQQPLVRAYWGSYPEQDVLMENTDLTKVLEDMHRESTFRKKALEAGLIRPFLLLISMTPKRRAAMGVMMGIKLTKCDWYFDFDPHHEAWHLLSLDRKGLQARSNSSARSLNPLAENSNWYMILYACAKKVRGSQSKILDKEVKNLVKGRKKSYGDSKLLCRVSKNPALGILEEVVLLMFLNIVESTGFSAISAAESTPEMKAIIVKLKEKGFRTELFLKVVAHQYSEKSASKRANEMYSWGEYTRQKSDRVKKKDVAGVAGLTLLSGALLTAAVPMVVVAPPLALIPAGLGAGVGAMAVSKATPGGLVSIVVGCLQQRLSLANAGIVLETFY